MERVQSHLELGPSTGSAHGGTGGRAGDEAWLHGPFLCEHPPPCTPTSGTLFVDAQLLAPGLALLSLAVLLHCVHPKKGAAETA